MKEFNNSVDFKAEAEKSAFAVKELAGHIENPTTDLVATVFGFPVGFYSDNFGYVAENEEDMKLIRNPLSDWYICYFG